MIRPSSQSALIVTTYEPADSHDRVRQGSRVRCLVSQVRARVSLPGVARGRAEVIAGGGGTRRAKGQSRGG